MNPLQSLLEYEQFIYTLPRQYPVIRRSTLTVIRRGATVARLIGEVEIRLYHLVVREKLSFIDDIGQITAYGYEVWQGKEKLYWYDSQEHPHDLTLAITHPHHKHVPPDIKHNRIPAPELTFTSPNLPYLIQL